MYTYIQVGLTLTHEQAQVHPGELFTAASERAQKKSLRIAEYRPHLS